MEGTIGEGGMIQKKTRKKRVRWRAERFQIDLLEFLCETGRGSGTEMVYVCGVGVGVVYLISYECSNAP